MMQSCASATGSGAAGPFYKTGTTARVRIGAPPPRIVWARHRHARWAPNVLTLVLRGSSERVRPARPGWPLGGLQHHPARHLAGVHIAPQRDQKLARQRHDHDLAGILAAVGGAGAIPLGQVAVLLVQQPAPRQLQHGAAHPRIAGLGQALFAPLGAAFIRRAGQSRIARHRAVIAQVPRQHLVHEPVRGLDPDARHLGQHQQHRMGARLRRRLELL